jgi:hypothetical protein
LNINIIYLFIYFNILFFDVNELTISVIVPCSYKHFIFLEELLNYYEIQTRLPDEIVISISEIDKIDKIFLNNLINKNWKFPIKYILTDKVKRAGENRNTAAEISIGDIIVTQDADDIPDTRRLEIIEYFFKKFEIDHLLHSYNYSSYIKDNEKAKKIWDNYLGSGYGYNMNNMEFLPIEKIPYIFFKNLWDLWNNGERFHAGNIAIRKKVFEQLKWGNELRGQDIYYNEKICEKKFKSIFINQPLIIYCPENSSYEKFSYSKLGKNV